MCFNIHADTKIANSRHRISGFHEPYELKSSNSLWHVLKIPNLSQYKIPGTLDVYSSLKQSHTYPRVGSPASIQILATLASKYYRVAFLLYIKQSA